MIEGPAKYAGHKGAELVHHKSWDINTHVTGRFKNGKPVLRGIVQNGLNDIEPDGSFVPCDMAVEQVDIGVTTHKVKRGRYGELRFTDTGSDNKHLCKIKNKEGKGLSFKYLGGDSSLPDVSNGKPLFSSSDGVTIEHTPTYNGVRIELVIDDPLTAPLEYPFSIKEYGQDYTYTEQSGGLVAQGEDGETITIKAPYAIDADGNYGPVVLQKSGATNNLQTFRKIIDETWLRQAAPPVRIDPTIVIDRDSGTFIDTLINSNSPTFNQGALVDAFVRNRGPADRFHELMKADTSALSGTVIAAHFGIDLFQGIFNQDIAWHRVLLPWIEGTKVNTTATTGEPSYNDRAVPTPWNVAGCLGNGTDRQTIAEGSATVTAIDTDYHLDMTVATVQAWFDNAADNHGIMIDAPNVVASKFIRFRPSETTIGMKPYLSVEFIEVAAGRRRRMLLGRN